MSDAESLLVADSLSDRYVVIRSLGGGGYGKVLLVEDLLHSRRLTMKLAKDTTDDRVRRLRSEAALLQSVSHPALPIVRDVGQLSDGRPYLCYDFIEGLTLTELGHKPCCDVRSIMLIGAAIARLLGYLVSRGVIHGDITPRNILIPVVAGRPVAGSPKVIDFGSAHILQTHDRRTRLRPAFGSLHGTAPYMAPEQAAGRGVTLATDVFALAACLFSAIYGHPPTVPQEQSTRFEIPMSIGSKAITVTSEILLQTVVLPPEPRLPPAAREILLGMLTADPDERERRTRNLSSTLAAAADCVGPATIAISRSGATVNDQ